MAAISASQKGANVVLLEKNLGLGKKLLLTGGGRCNLANIEFTEKNLGQTCGREAFFFLPALNSLNTQKTIEFFNQIGVKTKIEKNGKVYCLPAGEAGATGAKNVLHSLEKQLKKNNVLILTDSKIKEIKKLKGKISKIVLDDKKEITAKSYILATGGKSYCQTGSTGDGYSFAKKLGHKIETLRPGLTPIEIKEEWVKELQGLSLKSEKLNIFLNSKKIFSETGDIIFTHFGLSGPAILNASTKIGELLAKGEVKISLDLFPDMNQEETEQEFQKLLSQNNKVNIANLVAELFPHRLSDVILKLANIDGQRKCGSVSKKEWQTLAKQMKSLEMTVTRILEFDMAMITAGGVSLKEIDAKTMRSKIISNLFFAGEIINLHGPTGGYNLQICWSTGHLAGQSVATN
jgi:hypothetical protein